MRNYLKSADKLRLKNFCVSLIKSKWLFPFVLTIILFTFTALKINGSSLEIYNYILGAPQGPALITNQPQAIRSDEWLVATQLTIAQRNNHYERINHHIGYGEDMSLIADVPVKDWSTFFRPENWSFFIMPFNYAFAFKWWLLAYLLILACYFFILTLLPGKRMWAVLISVSLLFSPFVQWWYQFTTLAPIYYALLLAIIFMHLIRAKTVRNRISGTICLTYIATCFVLILYPPFMIACAIGLGAFCIGYLLEQRGMLSRKILLTNVWFVIGSVIFAGVIVGLFIATRADAVKALNNTVYPGKRIVAGGGYDVTKIFSGYLDAPLQNTSTAPSYGLNPSENSNFILLSPFLFLPSVYLLVLGYRQKKVVDWPLLAVNLALIILYIRVLSPFLDPLLKPFLLWKVPPRRLLIGLGLLNILQLILFLRQQVKTNIKNKHFLIAGYAALVLIIELLIGLLTNKDFPGYIGSARIFIFSAGIALTVYLIMARRIVLGILLLVLFSFYTTHKIHPLYRGTAPLTDTLISTVIKNLSAQSNGRWISESLYYENFPQMNGANSLAGVYPYPQLNIWKNIPPRNPKIYNRYAHVVFIVNHTDSGSYPTHLELKQDDTFAVVTEPCSSFLKQQNVKFILAQSPIDNKCVKLKSTVAYPSQSFFIYEIK